MLEGRQGDRSQSSVSQAQLRSPRFVPRISESCGGFQAGSDVAGLVRKIVLGSIVEDGRRGRSGDWGPVRGPLQQGMRGAFLTCGGSSEGEGREMDAEPFKL